MNALTGFIVTAVLATGLAAVIVLVLRRALYDLLVELCGNDRRARFWGAFCSVFIVLTALFGVLVSLPPSDTSMWQDFPQLRGLLTSFRAGVCGLLSALGGIAFVLMRWIGRLDANARRPGGSTRASSSS